MDTDREKSNKQRNVGLLQPKVKEKIMLSSSMFSPIVRLEKIPVPMTLTTTAYDSLKISAIELALRVANGTAKRGDNYWCDFQPKGYWLNVPCYVSLTDRDFQSNAPNQGTLNTLYDLAGYALCSDIIAL